MKFDVPKIVKAVRLSEYAAEFGETEILVWVNPPAIGITILTIS